MLAKDSGFLQNCDFLLVNGRRFGSVWPTATKALSPVKTLARTVCCRVFRIDAQETSYVRRGFRGATEEMRKRIERIGAVFTEGYHHALESPTIAELTTNLEKIELEL